MKNSGKQIHMVFAIIVMAFILIQSALPADLSNRESHVFVAFLADLLRMNTRELTFLVRKSAHFMEYIILGVSLQLLTGDFLRDRFGGKRESPVSSDSFLSVLLPWVAGTLYAVTDEIHQIFVAGRSCEFRDVCIDSLGVAVGVLVIRLLRGREAGGRLKGHE